MKSSALITAMALACAAAVAAPASGADDTARSRNSTAAASDSKANPSGGGVVDKTKSALRRLGDKIRSAGNRGEQNRDEHGVARNGVRGSDTRAMGAPGTDPTEDPARRARMDEAYTNWQSRQK